MFEANSGSSLPSRPSIEFLRKLAKDRLKTLRDSKPETRLFETQLAIARDEAVAIGHMARAARHTDCAKSSRSTASGSVDFVDG